MDLLASNEPIRSYARQSVDLFASNEPIRSYARQSVDLFASNEPIRSYARQSVDSFRFERTNRSYARQSVTFSLRNKTAGGAGSTVATPERGLFSLRQNLSFHLLAQVATVATLARAWTLFASAKPIVQPAGAGSYRSYARQSVDLTLSIHARCTSFTYPPVLVVTVTRTYR